MIFDIVTARINDRAQEERLRRQRMTYAHEMMFDVRAIIDGHRLNFAGAGREFAQPNSFFTDIVLVHNEAEAQHFPYNVIVSWPSENHYTEGIITGIHWFLVPENIHVNWRGEPVRSAFTLKDFGLTYPLTITTLVDDWEKVNDLWRMFHCDERDVIQRNARRYPHPWTIQPYYHQNVTGGDVMGTVQPSS